MFLTEFEQNYLRSVSQLGGARLSGVALELVWQTLQCSEEDFVAATSRMNYYCYISVIERRVHLTIVGEREI